MATIRAVRRTKSLQRRPLRVDGQLRGYLYHFAGETFNQLAADAAKRCGALFCGRCWWPCLACWQGLAWFWVTGRSACSPPVAASGDSISAIKPGGPQAGAPAERGGGAREPLTLPGRLPISGIGWPTAIASAVNLAISHDLRTP